MTAVALRPEQGGQLVHAEEVHVVPTSLQAWAEDARQAAAVAQSLAPTPFVPQSLRHRSTDKAEEQRVTVGNITAAILTGAELGLTPMAALRSVVVIQGTPAMTAVALRGLVQSKGHDIWVESSSDTRVVVCGQRLGSDRIEKSVWTIDRARQLGLTTKDNWKKQPEAMLIARGTSEVGRRIAADVLLGMPYSVEELRDETADSPARTARRRSAPAAEPTAPAEPDLEDPAPAEPVAVTAAEPASEPDPTVEEPVAEPGEASITKAQLTALNAALTQDYDLTDRDDKLAYLSGELGREIGSSSEVTKAEASRLLDAFAREREQHPEPSLENGDQS